MVCLTNIFPFMDTLLLSSSLSVLYEFLIKFIWPQECGQRPLPQKNEVNTFLTAAQAVCRETA